MCDPSVCALTSFVEIGSDCFVAMFGDRFMDCFAALMTALGDCSMVCVSFVLTIGACVVLVLVVKGRVVAMFCRCLVSLHWCVEFFIRDH